MQMMWADYRRHILIIVQLLKKKKPRQRGATNRNHAHSLPFYMIKQLLTVNIVCRGFHCSFIG